MREAKLRRIFRRAVFTASLVTVGAVVPNVMAGQTPSTDPAVTQARGTDDYDNDRMDWGWVGLLGLAGLLGLRRRDNVDHYTPPSRKP